MTSTLDRKVSALRNPGLYAAAAGMTGILYITYWVTMLPVLMGWWSILIMWHTLKYMMIAYYWLAVQTVKWSKFLWRACVNGYAHMVR